MKNDMISREAAIDAIVNSVSEIGLHDNSEVARYGATFRQHEIIDIIEGLPSTQPERKKGWWLTSDDMYETGICSVCGHDSQEPVSYTITMYKYCPNCGADMRGEEHDK